MLYFEFWSHDCTNKLIMRSKLLIMLFWILICHKNDHEIKTLKSIIRQFRCHEKCCDQEIIIRNFDLMIEVSTSWKSWILVSWNLTSWSIPKLEESKRTWSFQIFGASLSLRYNGQSNKYFLVIEVVGNKKLWTHNSRSPSVEMIKMINLKV